MAGAVRRFPFLEDAGMVTLVCHPDAMTPDGNPLLGPLPGVPGFWVAAGLSLNGFGGAGGIGKAIAEWMTAGETELDTDGIRAWRFGDAYRDPGRSRPPAREVYRYYYRLRYPLDADMWGRPNRLSPLHGRLQEAGAVFGSKNGWERADHLRPGEAVAPGRRRSAGYGWTARPGSSGWPRSTGGPRAGRDDRHDLVRQDRGDRAGRAGAARARVGNASTGRPAASIYTQWRTTAAGSSPTSRSPGWPSSGSAW